MNCFQRLINDFPKHPSIRMIVPPSKVKQATATAIVEKLKVVPLQSLGSLVMFIVKLPIVRVIKLVLIKRAPPLILAALIRLFIFVLCQLTSSPAAPDWGEASIVG